MLDVLESFFYVRGRRLMFYKVLERGRQALVQSESFSVREVDAWCARKVLQCRRRTNGVLERFYSAGGGRMVC
jgi:hypothetical protein